MVTGKKIFFLFFILFSFFVVASVQAQAIPFKNLLLQIVPEHASELEEVILPKQIKIASSKNRMRVFWYSFVKEEMEDTVYKTYKVVTKRGIIETDVFENKFSFFPPALWGNGYIRTDTSLALWVSPELLNLKGKKKQAFNVGLINPGQYLLTAAPAPIAEKISFLQNLYDQYVTGTELRRDVKLSKAEQRELNHFIEDFFQVRRLEEKKYKITVNQKEEDYPVVVLGNDFYQLTVVEDPLNPLVVALNLEDKAIPKIFKEPFAELKTLFEFHVDDITY